MRTTAKWTIAWLGGAVLGVLNGTVREATYRRAVGERRAEQISTATLIAALAGYFAFLERRAPIPTRDQAYRIGAVWAALTVAFEFGFGHYVDPDRKTWSELAANYDLTKGRLWPLVPAFMLVGPAAARRLDARSGT
jgi:hypothetical protein